MASYRFDAKDHTGTNITGEVQAPNAREAARQLQSKGLFVMRLKEELPSYAQGKGPALWRRFFAPVLWPAGPKASAIYFHSFASLLDSGVSAREAALLMSERAPMRVFKNASKEMAEAALRGDSVVTVTPRYPAGFPPFVIAMLQAGDRAGKLDLAMRKLNQYFERAAELASKYRWQHSIPRSCWWYSSSSCLHRLWRPTHSPRLAALNANTDPTPHITAKELIVALLAGILPTILAIVVIWYGWRALMRWRKARIAVDRIKLSVPGLAASSARPRQASSVAPLHAVWRWGTSTRSTRGGRRGERNAALAATVSYYGSRVMEGDTVASVMAATSDFPDLAVDMMTVGEKAGKVEESLDKVADYLAAESTEAGSKTALAVGLIAYAIIAALILSLVYTVIVGYLGRCSSVGHALRRSEAASARSSSTSGLAPSASRRL